MNEDKNKNRDDSIIAAEMFEAVKKITDKGKNAEVKRVKGVYTVMEVNKRIEVSI